MSEYFSKVSFLSRAPKATFGWSYLMPVPAKEGHMDGVGVFVLKWVPGDKESMNYGDFRVDA